MPNKVVGDQPVGPFSQEEVPGEKGGVVNIKKESSAELNQNSGQNLKHPESQGTPGHESRDRGGSGKLESKG